MGGKPPKSDDDHIKAHSDIPHWESGLAKAQAAKQCGAKTNAGHPCRAPAMPNGRCRVHGGKSPGGPRGERNGMYRHGRRTNEAMAIRREVLGQIRLMRELLRGGLAED